MALETRVSCNIQSKSLQTPNIHNLSDKVWKLYYILTPLVSKGLEIEDNMVSLINNSYIQKNYIGHSIWVHMV